MKLGSLIVISQTSWPLRLYELEDGPEYLQHYDVRGCVGFVIDECFRTGYRMRTTTIQTSQRFICIAIAYDNRILFGSIEKEWVNVVQLK